MTKRQTVLFLITQNVNMGYDLQRQGKVLNELLVEMDKEFEFEKACDKLEEETWPEQAKSGKPCATFSVSKELERLLGEPAEEGDVVLDSLTEIQRAGMPAGMGLPSEPSEPGEMPPLHTRLDSPGGTGGDPAASLELVPDEPEEDPGDG